MNATAEQIAEELLSVVLAEGNESAPTPTEPKKGKKKGD
jgi:hypothetical protein